MGIWQAIKYINLLANNYCFSKDNNLSMLYFVIYKISSLSRVNLLRFTRRLSYLEYIRPNTVGDPLPSLSTGLFLQIAFL